jgi:hypothetical protein
MGSLYTVAALDGQTKHHLEETIRSMANDAQNFCVMCVGHNKGWEEVSSAAAAAAKGWVPVHRQASLLSRSCHAAVGSACSWQQ